MPRLNEFPYDYLLEDPVVKRWYDNLARGSEITADVYRRRLGAFTNKHLICPAELAMETSQIEGLLMDHVTEAEKRYTSDYVNCTKGSEVMLL
jgi:hypothetical protein